MTQELTRLGEEQRPKPRNSWSKPSNHPESWKTMWNHGESSRFIDADRGSMTKHKVQVWFVGLSSLVWMCLMEALIYWVIDSATRHPFVDSLLHIGSLID